ncbi:MAG: peptidyl-prolyl cis-trans isomerase [Myxococcaceae bacterium]|nr:peptidyl-prolyl cis-trans isomerase [Myxococcaceae bacterium]MCI0669054.1 peptidyl-prolyl cis-trans isomerase [Myxococcaceae bacterium]
MSSTPLAIPSLLVALLALAVAPACRPEDPDALGPDVVAHVNGEVIQRADFERELQRELAATELRERTPEQVEPFKRALLDSAVERTLLLQAARELNIQVGPEEVDRRVLRISADFPDEQFESTLAQSQLSMAQLKQRTHDMLVVEKLLAQHVYARVAVTEAELRDAWAKHEAEFTEPERVRMAQIVVRELDEARRLLAQLKAGKGFAELARRYSLSADAKVGGDLGFFARGVMPPAFDEWAFRLAPGQVSDVVATDYGFHLFKVLERKPSRKRELSEVRGELESKLLAERRGAAQAKYIAELKAKRRVRINEAALQLVTARPAGTTAKD